MLANTCLADNLSTLSTFNWGKLQLLNVDFFVYIKLSTFLCQKAVSPYISTLSCVFHQMAFLWKLFLSTLSTFLKTLDFTGLMEGIKGTAHDPDFFSIILAVQFFSSLFYIPVL